MFLCSVIYLHFSIEIAAAVTYNIFLLSLSA